MATPFTSVYDPIPTGEPFTSVYNAPPKSPTDKARATKPAAVTSAPADDTAITGPKAEGAALSQALGTSMQPYGINFEKLKTKKAIDVVPSLLTAGQELAKAQAEENRAKMEGEALQAKEKASALERHAETVRGDVAAQERKLAEFPYPEFHPTKENAQSLGELFSVMSTMGVLLGGAGKLSSLNALNAMGGMLKGWQAGRADLFKREKETFDKEFQRIKAIHEDLKRTFDEYMKVRAVDKEAAMYKAQELATKAGANSIIAAQINVGAIKAVGESLKAVADLKNNLEDRQARAEEAAARRKFELQKLDIENEYRKDLEKKKSDYAIALEQAKKEGRKLDLPKDTKTKDEYRARYEVIKNIDDIQSLLENPKYSQYITPLTKFTPDIIANLGKEFPELQQKLARIQAIEFQIGGKALTAAEQKILEPIYGWRGLTVDALKERLKGTKDNFALTNSLTEEYYPGLKDVRARFDQAYEKTGRVPSLPSTDSSDRFEVGKAYIDDKGRKATYLGNGQWKEQ